MEYFGKSYPIIVIKENLKKKNPESTGLSESGANVQEQH